MNENKANKLEVERRVENWLTSVVIGLNLCPFAGREYRRKRIRFCISTAESEEDIVRDLLFEFSLLRERDRIETTLLILPSTLAEFEHFNDFLGFADALIEEIGYSGEFQLASFHPDYQFAHTIADDVENFTNRAPYPILHLLRETSLDRAVTEHPDTSRIPLENVALMNKLGSEHMIKLLEACTHPAANGG